MVNQHTIFINPLYVLDYLLISKNTTLPSIYHALKLVDAAEVRTIEMAQGQKISRFVAWTFHDAQQQAAWATERWR